MYKLYHTITTKAEPILNRLLAKRLKVGKEDESRLPERRGVSLHKRPEGRLIWVHAASVGEAQSALILIKSLLAEDMKAHILVTSGTLTSAQLLEKNLPERAIHQFYPLDHPKWVERFLNHWHPSVALWMESELWPNMLNQIKQRRIPAVLINAHLSPRSYKRWKWARAMISPMLGTFHTVLCQTRIDAQYFESLGAKNVKVTDNLKYSAAALPFDAEELQLLTAKLMTRPIWLYASTHAGEEKIACDLHSRLKQNFPDLLTIIVPRHPDRRLQISDQLSNPSLNIVFRGDNKLHPHQETDIYIADTIGELGLFYRLCPIAVIGRSFSDDGGGGHNPIEAAQLNSAVLHGPNVHNLQAIYDEMHDKDAAKQLNTPEQLYDELYKLLTNKDYIYERQTKAVSFARQKTAIIDKVMSELKPVLELIPLEKTT